MITSTDLYKAETEEDASWGPDPPLMLVNKFGDGLKEIVRGKITVRESFIKQAS